MSQKNPNTHILEDTTKMNCLSAEILVDKIKNVLDTKKYCSVSLPTGSTPQGMYKILIRDYKDKIDWEKIIFFQLDEYIGLPASHPHTYQYQLKNEILDPIGILEKNRNHIMINSDNIEKFCQEYEELIKKEKGIDIIVLGIGPNGHIAFNEPNSSFNSRTRIIKLEESTRQANSRFFDNPNDMPTHAVTTGLETIFSGKDIILLASGKIKAEAIYKTLKLKPSIKAPASILQLHKNVTFILDKQEASKI